MDLYIKRTDKNSTRTIGSMYEEHAWLCYTLEDPVRAGEKIPGDTAIPAGAYQVIINHSPHFDKDLPLLLNVPNFEGVRVHSGNSPADTRGCILVGLERNTDYVLRSRLAMDLVRDRIQAALNKHETVTLHIG